MDFGNEEKMPAVNGEAYADDGFFGESVEETMQSDAPKQKFSNRRSSRFISGSTVIGKRELSSAVKDFIEHGVLNLELGDKQDKGYVNLSLTIDESGVKPVIHFDVETAKLSGRPRTLCRSLTETEYRRIAETFETNIQSIISGEAKVSSVSGALTREFNSVEQLPVSNRTVNIIMWVLKQWYVGMEWGRFIIPDAALHIISEAFTRLGKEAEYRNAVAIMTGWKAVK